MFKIAEESQQAAQHSIDSLGAKADKAALMEPVLANYRMVFDEYPSSAEAEQALFKVGELEAGLLNRPDKAVETFKLYANAFPSIARAQTAMFMVGYLYNNNLAMIDSARAAYMRFLARYPQSELATSAQFELDNLGKKPDDLLLQEKPSDQPKVASKQGK